MTRSSEIAGARDASELPATLSLGERTGPSEVRGCSYNLTSRGMWGTERHRLRLPTLWGSSASQVAVGIMEEERDLYGRACRDPGSSGKCEGRMHEFAGSYAIWGTRSDGQGMLAGDIEAPIEFWSTRLRSRIEPGAVAAAALCRGVRLLAKLSA